MSFSLATFNVRDFFDDEAPQVIGELDRGEYTPEKRERARLLLKAKVEAVANVVSRLDADVVCLQEIKNERVVRLTLEALEGHLEPYSTVVVGGGDDARGIKTALISRLALAGEPRRHTTSENPQGFCLPRLAEGDPEPVVQHFRRGLLEVPLRMRDGSRLVVFNVHLKSNYPVHLKPATSQGDLAEGIVRAGLLRLGEALQVRRLVDQRLAEQSPPHVIVAGDFNQGPESMVVRAVAGDPVEGVRRNLPGWLHSATGGIPAERRWTIHWRGSRELLDHILVSRSMWARFQEARILNEVLYDPDAALRERAREGAESDHAAVLARFR